ncbi:hypothetical protein GI582_24475 [Sulfitobacter sp. BDSS02]|uniref:hypothetical protein n=1 Tax=Heliomarina sp. TaxID=2917556 RepID=UPI0040589B61|nr:hypothetical protein [Sulfitobacter sp. BDSS02]MBR9852419.1 hypothetical protein [Paracoccaceae bacterium]
MTTTITPTLTAISALPSLQWLSSVSDRLGDPAGGSRNLVGIDIGHVDTPRLTVSEACAGFVMRNGRLEATIMNFTGPESATFRRIQRMVAADSALSRITHQTLGAEGPQINTLVFRTFTLAYALDLDQSALKLAGSFAPSIVLHRAAAAVEPNHLSHKIQTCLNSFVSAQDGLGGVEMSAPKASVLAQLLGKVPA